MDTSNSVAVADGDLISTTIQNGSASGTTTSSRGAFTSYSTIAYDQFGGDNATRSVATRFFSPYGRVDGVTTEAEAVMRHGFSGRCYRMRALVRTNTRSGTTTVRLRKNGNNGNQTFTVGAGATGAFEDTTNSDTFTDDDEICMTTTGGGSGDLWLNCTGITEEPDEGQPYVKRGGGVPGMIGARAPLRTGWN
jgi:hypothetical protein